MKRILLLCIKLYRLLGGSGLIPSVCRFSPTCSGYTQEAVQIHGAGKGLWLGICRILRCGPWSAGGPDPVENP